MYVLCTRSNNTHESSVNYALRHGNSRYYQLHVFPAMLAKLGLTVELACTAYINL